MGAGRVIVVGSINVDFVVQLPRLPRPGETVGDGTFTVHLGGKGANQAAAAARLGARVGLVGMLGDDDEAQLASTALRELGIDLSGVSHAPTHTGIAQIMVSRDGENLIGVAPGANGMLAPDAVRDEVRARARQGDVVVTNLEIPLAAVTAAVQAGRDVGAVTIVNPAPAIELPPSLLRGIDVLVPNEHELRSLSPQGPLPLIRAGVGAVVETRGAAGVGITTGDGVTHEQPAFPADVVDTTGAGDAFVGVLAASMADGRSLRDAVTDAAAAGACVVEGHGARANAPTREQVAERRAARSYKVHEERGTAR